MPLLAPGFQHPTTDSQSTFRAVMDSMARPGVVNVIAGGLTPPEPLSAGIAAVALTLLDYDTPVFLDTAFTRGAEVTEWLRFHTGAPIVTDPNQASFVLLRRGSPLMPFDRFNLGDLEYPDRSATIVLEVDGFNGVQRLQLTGPGVHGAHAFSPDPLPEGFLDQRTFHEALFPCGVDFIFASSSAVAAIPRSSRIVSEV